MAKELAKGQEKAFGEAESVEVFGEGFNTEAPELEDLQPPFMKLLSGNSAEVQGGEGLPGEYFTELTGSLGKEITFIPGGIQKVRKLWNEDGSGVECQSNDMITGEGTPGGDCETCPMAQRVLNEEGFPGASECKPSTRIAGFIEDGENGSVPVIFELGMNRGARMATSQILRPARAHGFGNYAVRLGSKEEKTRKFTYIVPKVLGKPIT